MSTLTLKPGLLVSLKTSIRGGIDYVRQELSQGDTADGRGHIEEWQTRKVIADKEQYAAAVRLRSGIAAMIRRQCVHTSFGLLCPAANEDFLDAAVERARREARGFNASQDGITVGVYVLKGRVASTEEEATRAVASEVRSLLDTMRDGIQAFDARMVREAAAKARELKAMLSDDDAGKIAGAIKAARAAARVIVARVDKDGEDAATVLGEIVAEGGLTNLDAARFAFVDDDAREQPDVPEVLPARITED